MEWGEITTREQSLSGHCLYAYLKRHSEGPKASLRPKAQAGHSCAKEEMGCVYENEDTGKEALQNLSPDPPKRVSVSEGLCPCF